MRIATATLSALTVSGLVCGAANAGVIASDTFDTDGGGTGWAAGSDWDNKVSGGQYSGTGQTFREFASTILPVPASDFWVYTEMSIASNSWGGISFYNGNDEVLMFGRDTGNQTWGIDGSFVTDTYTTVPWVAGETVTLVGHVEYLTGHANGGTGGDLPGDDRVTLWVNPTDLNDLANTSEGIASRLDNNLGPYTRVRLGTGSSGLTVDNLYITDDLVDITAVIPEPSSLALMGLGGLLIARRRRG